MSEIKINEIERKMQVALDMLAKEFSGLRTGRASVNLLEPVMVEAYGSKMHLSQLASVSAPESRMLTVQVWDNQMASAVEKAIRDAALGLNPIREGQVIRVPLPELSKERRQEISKVASKYAEQARIAVRNVRRDGMDLLKKQEKEGLLSEDQHHKLSNQIQTLTDNFIRKVDELLAQKEKDIMQV
jgi:ribosome recycling factor